MPILTIDPSDRPSSRIEVVPFVAPAPVKGLPLLNAYIDETGDRGSLVKSPKSSPFFGMAAVVVDAAAETAARAALRALRADFKVPDGKPLHAKEHIKTHDRRVHAAKALAAVPGLKVIYVAADKAALRPGSYRDDVTLFYNFMAYSTLQRILWLSRRWSGTTHRVGVHFGHVAHHPHHDTHAYFQIKSGQDRSVPFHLIDHLDWYDARKFEMSQVADVYGIFLKAALWPNDFGNVESAYLRTIWHQIRQDTGCPISLGFRYSPSDDLARALPWWPCTCTKCSTSP